MVQHYPCELSLGTLIATCHTVTNQPPYFKLNPSCRILFTNKEWAIKSVTTCFSYNITKAQLFAVLSMYDITGFASKSKRHYLLMLTSLTSCSLRLIQGHLRALLWATLHQNKAPLQWMHCEFLCWNEFRRKSSRKVITHYLRATGAKARSRRKQSVATKCKTHDPRQEAWKGKYMQKLNSMLHEFLLLLLLVLLLMRLMLLMLLANPSC